MKPRTFLITKASHQSKNLIKTLSIMGHHTVELPCIHIENLTIPKLELQNIDLCIFTSVNAVQAACRDYFLKFERPILAIGPATQKALEPYSSNIVVPDTYSSEGLLKLPVLEKINGKRIAIFTGLHPKSTLGAELEARGAQIKYVLCYRRVCPSYDEKTLAAIMAQPIDTIIATSPDILTNLGIIFSQHRPWLRGKMLIVVSDKMHAQATAMGFAQITQASNATDSAILHRYD